MTMEEDAVNRKMGIKVKLDRAQGLRDEMDHQLSRLLLGGTGAAIGFMVFHGFNEDWDLVGAVAAAFWAYSLHAGINARLLKLAMTILDIGFYAAQILERTDDENQMLEYEERLDKMPGQAKTVIKQYKFLKWGAYVFAFWATGPLLGSVLIRMIDYLFPLSWPFH